MKRERAEVSLDHFLENLSAASGGYPRVESSAYAVTDLGLSRLIDDGRRFAVPTTSEAWSALAESVIVQQRESITTSK
jgi:hypothetical protein